MSYWDETDQYLRRHGGTGPPCPTCGREMAAADDHGRFTCFSCDFGTFDTVTGMRAPTRRIEQVDASQITDQEKALIPPINRMHDTPTAAEARFMALASRGPECMDDPEYIAARKAVDEERRAAREAVRDKQEE